MGCTSSSSVYSDGDGVRRDSRLFKSQDSVRLRKQQLADRDDGVFNLQDAVAMGERDGASLKEAREAGEAVESAEFADKEEEEAR